MSNIAETIGANGFKDFAIHGDFLRLMNSTGNVEITYFRNGSEIARTGSIQAGYAEEFRENFDAVRIRDKSGAANTVELLYRVDSSVRYDRSVLSGNFGTTKAGSLRKAFVQTAPSIGTADSQLVAAKADRNYLMIQNTHASQNLFVRLDGVAATTANGLRIGPGGSLELFDVVPTAEIRAIASGAATTCIVLEA